MSKEKKIKKTVTMKTKQTRHGTVVSLKSHGNVDLRNVVPKLFPKGK